MGLAGNTKGTEEIEKPPEALRLERKADASEKDPGAWHNIRAEMDLQRAQHRGAGCRLELGEMLPAVQICFPARQGWQSLH